MRNLPIAYGGSCNAKSWTNKTITYEGLKDRLRTTIRTPESAEEYQKILEVYKVGQDYIKEKKGEVEKKKDE